MPSKIEVALALSDKILLSVLIIAAILGSLLLTGIINILTAVVIGLVMAVVFIIAVYKIVQAQFAQPKVGEEALIGKKGRVTSSLKPEGMIMVEGEYWGAIGQELIEEGEEVEIVSVEGLKLRVKRAGVEIKSGT